MFCLKSPHFLPCSLSLRESISNHLSLCHHDPVIGLWLFPFCAICIQSDLVMHNNVVHWMVCLYIVCISLFDPILTRTASHSCIYQICVQYHQTRYKNSLNLSLSLSAFIVKPICSVYCMSKENFQPLMSAYVLHRTFISRHVILETCNKSPLASTQQKATWWKIAPEITLQRQTITDLWTQLYIHKIINCVPYGTQNEVYVEIKGVEWNEKE